MSKIVDGILYSKITPAQVPWPQFKGNLGEYVLDGFNRVYQNFGDFEWIINGPFDATNKTSTCGLKRRKVSQVDPSAREAAAAFYAHGLRKGQTVHFVIGNSTENHILAIAAWLCQATVSLGDPGLSVNVLKSQIMDTNPSFIVCYDLSRATTFRALKDLNLLGKVKVIILELAQPKPGQDVKITEPGFQFYQDFLSSKDPIRPPSLQNGVEMDDENDIFVIFWSSGTTGNPKGIQHNIKYSKYMIQGLMTRGSISPVFSKYLQTTCYFHVGGFISPLNTMTAPLTFIFNHGQDLDSNDTTELLFKEIDLYEPYLMICGSHHLVQLSQSFPKDKSLDLNSVQIVMPMGSTVPLTLYEDLIMYLPSLKCVYQIYGMTEIGGTLTSAFNAETLGVVHPDSVLKIVDPENPDIILGPGQVGEIMAKSKCFMKGYLNKPQETEKFFGKDGFAHTGDLAHYDQNGVLHFDGRLKELIKYKNCHLYPLEIENIICSHPFVIEAGVFGRPDPTVQEYVTALVVKVPDAVITEQDIIDLVEKSVDDAKRLRGGVKFVEKLPKGSQGKLQRKRLLEVFEKTENK